MTLPAISVILPVFNGEKYLSKAIESILAQTFSDFELIIINDGSTDGSASIINIYADKDDRIVVVHQQNMKLINTLNYGLSLARAPLIARMDADDIALPERFARQIEFLNTHPDIVAVGSSIRLIDHDNKPTGDVVFEIKPDVIAETILNNNPIAHPAVMMRKDAVLSVGGYHPLYKHAEDYDLWLRLSEKYRLANLPEVLLLYRQHEDKISFNHSKEQTLNTFVAQLASKARRKTGVDPMDKMSVIPLNALDYFNLSKNEKSDLMARIYEYTVNGAIFHKNWEAFANVIAEMKAKATDLKSRRMYFTILEKECLFHYTRKEFSQIFVVLLKNFFIRPIVTIRISLWLFKMLLRTIYYKLVR